jgi:hypothetical protein
LLDMSSLGKCWIGFPPAAIAEDRLSPPGGASTDADAALAGVVSAGAALEGAVSAGAALEGTITAGASEAAPREDGIANLERQAQVSVAVNRVQSPSMLQVGCPGPLRANAKSRAVRVKIAEEPNSANTRLGAELGANREASGRTSSRWLMRTSANKATTAKPLIAAIVAETGGGDGAATQRRTASQPATGSNVATATQPDQRAKTAIASLAEAPGPHRSVIQGARSKCSLTSMFPPSPWRPWAILTTANQLLAVRPLTVQPLAVRPLTVQPLSAARPRGRSIPT